MDDMIILSGWAMPSTVFDPLDALCDIKCIGLPGLEVWPGVTKESDVCWPVLMQVMDSLLPEKPVTLVGWSLGGSLALKYAALFPHRVKRLVLIGFNPCFVARDDWPCGMNDALFKQFVEGLSDNNEATLKKFLFLCAQGAADTRQLLRELRQLVSAGMKEHHLQRSEALLPAMLRLLGDDLRQELHDVSCPVTHLLAEADGLVPASVSTLICQEYSDHHVVMNKGGHTFFRESADVVALQLKQVSLATQESGCL